MPLAGELDVSVLRVEPLVIVLVRHSIVSPTRRPLKNHRRGRLRMNLKRTPKLAGLPSLAHILDREGT